MLDRFSKKTAVQFLVLILAFTLLLVGCSTDKEDNTTDSTGTPTEQEGTSEATDDSTAGETRVITHAMGETPIEGTPERVVILTNEGTEALLALGVKPIGAVKSWLGDPWYDHIAEQMDGVEVVGVESQVNIEAIAALQPDLIIGNKMRQEEVYPQLSAIAPTVFADTLRGEWQINFKLYAEAVNKAAEGEQVLADFEQKIAQLREDAADHLDTEISIVRFMAGTARIYLKDTFSGIILEQIGFARPANQDRDEFVDEITKERVPEMDGDILFYFTYETGDGNASITEEEWTSDPLWNNLEVVKNNKAYKVDDAIWNTAGGVIAANLMLDELRTYFVE